MSLLRHIPNVITVFRLVLIPPVAWAIINDEYMLALVLFFIAGFSDGLDGFLARVFNWQSKLGSFLDPLADKLLTIVCFYLLAWKGLIPWWLFLVIILRDVIILGGAAAFHMLTHSLEMHPTMLSKVNTALQIVVILAILYSHGVSPLSAGLLQVLIALLFITSVLSGLLYVLLWSRKTRRENQA